MKESIIKERRIEVGELLDHLTKNGWQQSKRNEFLYYKKIDDTIQFLDLKSQECYAYENNTLISPHPATIRMLAYCKAKLDINQTTLSGEGGYPQKPRKEWQII